MLDPFLGLNPTNGLSHGLELCPSPLFGLVLGLGLGLGVGVYLILGLGLNPSLFLRDFELCIIQYAKTAYCFI